MIGDISFKMKIFLACLGVALGLGLGEIVLYLIAEPAAGQSSVWMVSWSAAMPWTSAG